MWDTKAIHFINVLKTFLNKNCKKKADMYRICCISILINLGQPHLLPFKAGKPGATEH